MNYRNNVRCDRFSINYVLLDSEPELEGSSLLVAHKIETVEKKDDIELRNTCLFPKKIGLISLCLLLFAPTVELRINEHTKKDYSGALCGLGYDKTIKRALFVEHDIENVFDAKFDHEDIDDVKKYLIFFYFI